MVVEEIGKLRLQDLISQKQKIGAPRPVAPEAIDTGQAVAGAALNADEAENRRRALALSVLREDNLKRFEQNGVRVRFFDIGTLETPPEITQEFVNAWTGDRAARLQAGQISLPAKRAQSRGRQISEVINHIANYWLSKQKESDKGTTATDVLRMYHIKLTELYKNTRTGWPEKTEEALQYIHQLSRPITIGE